MTKTLGRGPTRSQKSLTVLAAVALVASLITVYLPLPAQAANNAEFTFFFDNGAVLDATNEVGGDYTIPDQFFIDYYGGVENIPDGFDYQGRTLHVSCSETFPTGYAGGQNDFPEAPSSSDADHGWGIQSYTIVRHLPSGDRFCGETFEPAEITVVKNTTPETAAGFTFRLVGQMFPDPPQKSELVDFGPDDQAVAGDGGSYTWEVNSGSFTLSELVGQNPNDYEFDSVSCSVAGGGPNPGFVEDGASVSFDILGGQHVTCTFTNEGPPPEPGTIIVDKQVTPGSDPTQLFEFDASYDADGFSLSANSTPNNSGDLDPGTYSVSEDLLEGWTLESATCDDGSNPSSIDLDEGETVTCTFVNHEIQPGTVTVIKNVVGDQSAEFTFTGDVAGTIGHGESISVDAELGNVYASSEIVPEGWELTDISCVADGGTFEIGSDGVEMMVDEENGSVTCTFTNTEDGEIIVEKEVTQGSNESKEFLFETNGFVLEDNLLAHGESVSTKVDPGSGYTVKEIVPNGWTLEFAGCTGVSDPTNIVVGPGETVTCTFVNHQIQPGTIVVEKLVTQGSDQSQAFSFEETGFTLSDDTLAHGESGSAVVLADDGYGVEEVTPPGWILQSATCDNESDPSNISVGEGETVTCTFVNHEIQPGTVTVIKNVVGDQSAEFTFTGDVAGTIGHGELISVDAELGNVYASSEIVPEGWELTDISCVADGGTFEIGSDGVEMMVDEENGSVTCTFTNTEDGEIIVEKEVLGNSDQTQAFDFTPVGFTLDDTSLAHGEQASSGPIAPGGGYSVSETVPEGWTLVSATCDDGSDPSAINVAAGETVTCTFVNGELSSITVVKQTLSVDPEDDTTFAFTGDLSGNLGDGDSTSATVEPGSYETTETQELDWVLTSIACDEGATGDVENLTATYEVGYGDDITCTFTNVETEVLASVLVTVSGACIPDGDEGIGRITVNMSVDGAANVVVRDSDGDIVGSRSTSGTITVPEGATYTWEASANEGFEFPVDFEPNGEVTIDTCSEDEELPFTGLNTDTAVAIAALMLVAGLMMVRSATRREEN